MKKKQKESTIERATFKANVQQTIREINEISTSIDDKIGELMVKACSAKEKNLTLPLNLAKHSLAQAMMIKQRADEMSLLLDSMSSLSDISQITTDFLNKLGIMCDAISQYSNQSQFKKIGSKMSSALAVAGKQSEMVNAMMEMFDSNMRASDFALSKELENEIDKLIESNISVKADLLDVEIEKRLNKLKETE